MTTAQLVRTRVAETPVRGFLAVGEVPGPRRAVESAFSRLALAGELVRVRRGLYWKGPKTRVGMAGPREVDVGLEVAGDGAGLAGVSAAHALGLTTQVPAVAEIAVPGRPPVAPHGVRFASRPYERRLRRLPPIEVALIEVLRDWPDTSEADWTELASAVRRLTAEGHVRPEVITTVVADEHHVGARARWARLGVEETE